MRIIQADHSHLDSILPLFEGYIRFYRGQSDLVRFRSFLEARLTSGDATIFFAEDTDNQSMGFTLLYPSFSSVSQARIFILNDLFVAESYRNRGVASALLTHAAHYGRENGAIRLHLETEESNTNAQRLYASLGWKKEVGYFHYHLQLV